MSTPIMKITLEDVADINMVDVSEKSYSKVNGKDSVMISIQKQNNYATTEVAKVVEEELDSNREKSIEKGLTDAQVFMAVKNSISEDNKASTMTITINESK